MAITDSITTLAFHQSRVLTSHRDMSSTPCELVAEKIKEYAGSASDKGSCPQRAALYFYGLNHGVALVQSRYAAHEPLPQFESHLIASYHSLMGHAAVRAFYYLLLICTREARHNKSIHKDAKELAHLFGGQVADFFAGIQGGESSIHSKLLSAPPKASIGDFCKALQWQFYNSKWGPNYGGKAWGNIADCLYRFVSGECTAEMMLDTVWTLSHNTSAIFNKGIYYQMHQPQHLLRILDVQRSGQVPEGVLHDSVLSSYADDYLKQLLQGLADEYPGKIGAYVDWEMVMSLGAIAAYQYEINEQHKKYGQSPQAKAAAEAKLKAAKEAELKAKLAAEEHAKNHFQIMPGLEAKIIHRKKAA